MTEAVPITPKSVDAWLDEVDYGFLNSGDYVPSEFALNFVNFIKLVNGDQGESHPSPVVHMAMLDKIAGPDPRVANLCSRGLGKTTIFIEYLFLYIAVFGGIEGFGKVVAMIYVSDSMENGVKSARKNIEFRYHNSEFLLHWLPKEHARFTDNYIEMMNKDGHRLGMKMFGAKALSLDSKLFLAAGGTTTIGACQVGDRIMGADGKPTTVTRKSEIFNKPMYELLLDDGRKLKVSEDHLNQVHVKRFQSERTFSKHTLEEKTLTTLELLAQPLFVIDPNGSQRPLLWVQNNEPMEWPESQDLLLDSYTAGVLIGDGSMNRKASGGAPVVLTGHEADWPTMEREIPYAFGKVWRDTRNPQTISRTVLGIGTFVAMHGLDCHGSKKRVPSEFCYGSVAQRLATLQGLMDTDGTCTTDGKASFCSASKGLVADVMWLVRSLGGTARWVDKGNTRAYQCSVRLNMPLFRLQRKLDRQRPLRNDKVAIVAINPIADEPSQCIAVDNEERQFVAEDFFRTHNTGLRGTKIFGQRPTICVLDDLVSDDDAKSKVAMEDIKDTVYKGVDYALDPTKRKILFNGTAFNKNDILYEAVESGGWTVNVWPICERFPCTKEEFKGAWEERFSYEFVKDQYELSVKTGRVASFMQELMLRITSDEDRVVLNTDIRWYKRESLLTNKSRFNFYITSDFTTSDKQGADFCVIAVWALNNNGDWFWVDGIRARQTMDITLNDLFRLVAEYKPMNVGIEVTGQQEGFVPWIQSEMMSRNVFFALASSGNANKPGIRPTANKMARFSLVVPLFKQGKIYFPEEGRTTGIVMAFLDEIAMVTPLGFKSKNDDCLDNISMLPMLKAWLPGEEVTMVQKDNRWEIDEEEQYSGGMASYIV
ncbi:MAG: hypothetical protein ACOH2T_19225 [Pseudomonas sp.]